MILASIDPGFNSSDTGYAIATTASGFVDSGALSCSRKRRHEDETEHHARVCATIGGNVAQLIEQWGVTDLVIEVGSFRSPAALERLRGSILAVAHLKEVNIHGVHFKTWQAWAAKHGWSKGDDANDARWLGNYWLEHGKL